MDETLIGRRLRELRVQQGMTQATTAEHLGVSQALVSQYERGELRLHGTLLAAYATLLKVSSDQILGLAKIEEGGLLRDRRFLRRIQKIDQLSKRHKQALLKSLDMLLKGAGVA